METSEIKHKIKQKIIKKDSDFCFYIFLQRNGKEFKQQ